MLDRRLTTIDAITEMFESIEPELYRFPAVDARELAATVARLRAHTES